MITVDVKYPRAIRLRNPGLTVEQVRDLALLSRDLVTVRIAHGINLYGQPARVLATGYKRRKGRKGAAGIRDWRFTGRLMAALDVTQVTENHATIGFRGEDLSARARILQQMEPMLGLAPEDRRVVGAAAQRMIYLNVGEMKVAS